MDGAVFPPCYLPGAKLWWASLVAQLVKNPPAMWETWVRSLGWEDPLEKGKATHSSILAWRIPYSPWVRKESDWETFTHSNYDGDNEDNGNLLHKVPCRHCYTQCPQPCSRPPPTHASAGDSWTLIDKSGSVSCGVTAPFSWVLVHIRFCLCPRRVLFPQSCVNSGSSMVGLMATSSSRAYAILKSAAPRGPASVAVPLLTHTSTERHSNTVLSQSL